jgi:pimeloyl-ACP methyl ester carboxylesterase
MTRSRKALGRIGSAVVAAALLLGASVAPCSAEFDGNPVIFVHGGFGSAGQFESQAMRFSSNGYPDSHLAALEYDSLFGLQSMDDVLSGLDDLIAELQASTGAAQVDLMGHSLGTAVSQMYLSTPERAAAVAHYVNIDGGEADAPPGGVETLAIWAGTGRPGRRIVGAQNVTIPNQTHVESATSAESFAAMYRFLTGKNPATIDIVRERGPIEISGRAVLFPQNEGVDGATVDVWEVYSFNGERRGGAPAATFAIGADGAFGPFHGIAGRSYEFVISRPDSDRTHRLYFEPFFRSSHFVRLLTAEPGGAIDSLIERSDRHMALTIVRYKELWGDQGDESDRLEIDGTNVLNEATSPQSNRTNGLFVFDAGSDGVTDLSAPISTIAGLPFLSGADLFIPAEVPARGRLIVRVVPRGDTLAARRVIVPRTASTVSAITIHLNDFEIPPARRSDRPLRLAVKRQDEP